MKKEMIKALLYYAGAVLLGLDLIFNDLLLMWEVRLLWLIAGNIIWGAGLAIYFAYLKVYWDIEQKEIEPIPIDTNVGDLGYVPEENKD